MFVKVYDSTECDLFAAFSRVADLMRYFLLNVEIDYLCLVGLDACIRAWNSTYCTAFVCGAVYDGKEKMSGVDLWMKV